MSVPDAGQGEVWDCQLDPVEGHEQAGSRPCLVVSVDELGKGPSELAIVTPITRNYRVRLDLEIEPPEGGLDDVSYAQPYQVRTVSRERLVSRRGVVRDATLTEVIKRIRILVRPPT